MRTLAMIALLALLTCASAMAATYHVDAINGDDTTGDGSASAPYQTVDHLWPWLTGGDTVVLYDGSYGTLDVYRTYNPNPDNLFDDWVTLRAADGHAPEFDFVRVGGGVPGTVTPDQGKIGRYDMYLRLVGLTILDGVVMQSGRHWELRDCKIMRRPPYTGSPANIEKVALTIKGGTDMLVQDCEITSTGTGIAGYGNTIRLVDNWIHHGSHDAVRVNGFWDSLIQGNRIHNFDDGVTDAETADDPNGAWSRHCDLLHIFIPGGSGEGWQNHNVVIRNNIFYDTEAQIVQFNNYYGKPHILNELILFENNVFGPSHANMLNNADPCDGLIFRNNSVVVVHGGRQFNRWLCNNYSLRISDESLDVEIYNNILGGVGVEAGADLHVFDWNLIQIPPSVWPAGYGDSRAFGRFTLVDVDPMYLDPESIDPTLDPASPAVDFGTRLYAPSPVFETDYDGTPRDNRPDLGAYEVPGRSPPAEVPLQTYPGPKSTFVDDFSDGHFNDVDPWLEAEGQQGLSWWQPDGQVKNYYVGHSSQLDGNALQEPIGDPDGGGRDAWVFSTQGADWIDYTLEFTAFNAYVTIGGGPLLLVVDQQNCYWLDISRDNGRLIRFMVDAQGNPTETVLAESDAIELPHSGARQYRISVAHAADSITFSVDADANGGDPDFVYVETDPLALERFGQGGIGFHSHNEAQYPRIHYDDISVSVSEFGAPALFEILYWDLAEDHGPAGEITFPVGDGAVAATSAGIRKLVTWIGLPVDPATLTPAAVTITGTAGGDHSAHVDSVTLGPDGKAVTIALSAPLPDQGRYTVSLSDAILSTEGEPLGGDRELDITALAGDVTGDRRVSPADLTAIRDRAAQAVDGTTARYDIDADGAITGDDQLAARALLDRSVP